MVLIVRVLAILAVAAALVGGVGGSGMDTLRVSRVLPRSIEFSNETTGIASFGYGCADYDCWEVVRRTADGGPHLDDRASITSCWGVGAADRCRDPASRVHLGAD